MHRPHQADHVWLIFFLSAPLRECNRGRGSANSQGTLGQPRRRSEVRRRKGDDVSKQIVACMSCLGILMSASMVAAQVTREATLNEVTVRGAVQAVDHAARTVTVQGENGNVVT